MVSTIRSKSVHDMISRNTSQGNCLNIDISVMHRDKCLNFAATISLDDWSFLWRAFQCSSLLLFCVLWNDGGGVRPGVKVWAEGCLSAKNWTTRRLLLAIYCATHCDNNASFAAEFVLSFWHALPKLIQTNDRKKVMKLGSCSCNFPFWIVNMYTSHISSLLERCDFSLIYNYTFEVYLLRGCIFCCFLENDLKLCESHWCLIKLTFRV